MILLLRYRKMIIIALAILSILGTVGLFVADYNRTKRDNVELKVQVEQLVDSVETQNDTISAAEARIGDFSDAIREFHAISELAQANARDARRDIRRVERTFEQNDLRELPSTEAGALASNTFNRLGRLLECETSLDPDCTSELAGAASEGDPAATDTD